MTLERHEAGLEVDGCPIPAPSNHSRRWQPADGSYVSTYSAGPPLVEVNVNAANIVLAAGGRLVELRVDECRWLAARLAEAAGINEVLRGVEPR